ncbi:peptidoglycan editing factor PgeF [Bacillus massilinigeriensis]|uniref:peptidoglycan editing factor PgeF n=1 Tax=Bacillus massilionigeriensis TaxID=1805475 RepID=UPI00096AEF4B|nr:peptidoglycan editing factor PgeF [Bacillus massilionigeriensis]
MDPFIIKEQEYFLIDDWCRRDLGLLAGFTTKNGGYSGSPFSSLNLGFHVSDKEEVVCQNRRKMSKLVEFPNDTWVGAEQTHGVHIETITREDRGRGSLQYETSFKSTDGFFTMEKGIMLTLLFADCVPLFFYAPTKGAIGIAHGGWKGTVGGIAGRMIDVFKGNGIQPSDIFIVIGPSICKKCYIVDNHVINLVQNILEDVEEKPYNLIKDHQYHLDLKQLNKDILIQNGVHNENIKITDYCTSCNAEHFFSHRRDQGQTGRMMGFIGFKEA